MERVYVVLGSWYYDSSEVLGVFVSEDAAYEFRARAESGSEEDFRRFDEYRVELHALVR